MSNFYINVQLLSEKCPTFIIIISACRAKCPNVGVFSETKSTPPQRLDTYISHVH